MALVFFRNPENLYKKNDEVWFLQIIRDFRLFISYYEIRKGKIKKIEKYNVKKEKYRYSYNIQTGNITIVGIPEKNISKEKYILTKLKVQKQFQTCNKLEKLLNEKLLSQKKIRINLKTCCFRDFSEKIDLDGFQNNIRIFKIYKSENDECLKFLRLMFLIYLKKEKLSVHNVMDLYELFPYSSFEKYCKIHSLSNAYKTFIEKDIFLVITNE